jgi:hypothetical protein
MYDKHDADRDEWRDERAARGNPASIHRLKVPSGRLRVVRLAVGGPCGCYRPATR